MHISNLFDSNNTTVLRTNQQLKIQLQQDYYHLRIGSLTWLIGKRSLMSSGLLILALIIVIMLNLRVGTMTISWHELFMGLSKNGNAITNYLIFQLRLPRLIAGLLCGAALGLSGLLLQIVTHNRLAMPDIIGINEGASAFAIISFIALPISIAPSVMALIGALTAVMLIFMLSGDFKSQGYRFIMIGVAIGVILGSIVNYLLSKVSIDVANSLYHWSVGSLASTNENAVIMLAWGLVFSVVIVCLLAPQFSLLRFSIELSKSLGLSVNVLRLIALLIAILCAAFTVAVAGPIGMIALLAPEGARHCSNRFSIPIINTLLLGAFCFTLADFLGRWLFSPIEIPVGIVTMIIGGPYLLWILLRQNSPALVK